MAAYLLVRIRVSDAEQFGQYRAAVPDVIAQFGGRYLVRGGAAEAYEGSYDGRRLVVIEFPSLEIAHRFWNSPEYTAVKKLRHGAAECEVIAVEGV
jgi:uncharacterized protein (DUF1330 family)